MKNPIIRIKTKDGINNCGIIFEAKSKEFILIHTHGTAGSFYESEFIDYISNVHINNNISFMSMNNRGTSEFYGDTYDVGCAVEIFENCIYDIDSWIKFALDNGYKKVILEGHSLGTEKVTYYMNKGKYKDLIVGVILLGFSDSYGTQMNFLESIDMINEELLEEAENLIKSSKENHLISKVHLSNCGETTMSAKTYKNFFSSNSEISKVLPFSTGKLDYFANIKVPILAIIGDKFEYTVIPISKAMDLLKNSNSLAEVQQLENCSHCFVGKEKELFEIISKFLNKHFDS